MVTQQSDPQKKIGKGMWYIAWICFLFVMYQFFSGALDNQHNPNRAVDSRYEDGKVVVVLERNRQGHYVTTGTINGQEVTFMVDTGATDVSVPAHIAEQLGLRRGPSGYASTANGTVKVYSSRIDSLEIGDLSLIDISASINPGMQSDEILLGMSALKRIEFAQRGNQLILKTY